MLKNPVTPLQILVAVLPFITGVFYEWEAALVTVALLVILVLKIKKTRNFSIEYGFPLLFTGLVVACHVLTAFWAVDKGMVWLGVVKFLPLLLFVLTASRKEDILRFLPVAGVVMTVVSVALSPIDALKGHVIVSGRIGGFFEYPNTFAMLLLICLILVLFKEKIRIMDWVFAAVYLAGIALSGSRTVIILTALTAIVFIVWVKDKKIKIIAAAAFVLAAAAAGIYLFNRLSSLTNGSTFYGRFLYYIDALPVILKHPFGLGYYGYYYTQGSFQTGVYSVVHIHNDFLQILLDIGWIPAVAGAVMIVKAFIKADFRSKVILAMAVLHLLFDFDMQFVSMSIILLAVVVNSSDTKLKTFDSKKIFAPSIAAAVVIAGLSVYFGLASFFNFLTRYDIAAQIYPAYTEAQKMMLLSAETEQEMGAAADSILKHAPNYSLANNAKARIAFSEGDVLAMMDYKEKAIRYNRYALPEYTDYLDMLFYSISVYAQSGDYESAQYCIEKCISVQNDLKRVEAGTSKLGFMIDDKPELDLPAEYAEYIAMLQSMLET